MHLGPVKAPNSKSLSTERASEADTVLMLLQMVKALLYFCWQRLTCPCLLHLPAGTQKSMLKYLLRSPLWAGGVLTCTEFPNRQRLSRPGWTAGISSAYFLARNFLTSCNSKVQRDAFFFVEQRGHCLLSFCCTKSFQWNSHLLLACSLLSQACFLDCLH